jgi:acetyl-CoA C-acetyltransferase
MLFIQAPELFTTTPALAIPKAIANAGLEPSHVDFYEINEAFSQYRLLHLQIESFLGFLQFF